MRAETTIGGGAGAQHTEKLCLTPRSNAALPQRLGDFSTLWEALDYAALGETGFNFYSSRGVLTNVLPYRRLRERAVLTAQRLLSLRLEQGARVAVIADTDQDFLNVFFGCQYAGLIPCPLPYNIYLGGKDAYVAKIAAMMACAGAALAISPPELAPYLASAAAAAGVARVFTHDELTGVAPKDIALQPFGADEPAYVQYSSGSTAEPKGVLITQRSITANAHAILKHGLKTAPGDRAFSWLPLYHDMGLVGFCIAPMMGQVSTDYLSTTAFARRPALWLKLMSENRSTVTYAPSFGYQLAGRRINGEAASLDLSALRIAGIGGDMVRADVLDEFSRRMKVANFSHKAFLPSYGMAEATLAVTFADLDKPVAVDRVDPLAFKHFRRAMAVQANRRSREPARTFVVCGRPLPGHELLIVDDRGRPLSDRQVGRIMIKGPSLMAGYFGNDEATASVMRAGGFMDTGDMGYMIDGQLVVTGRAKELILHNGRNIWPQDIEWAVERIDTLRIGDVAAFAVEEPEGEDHVVALVECRLTSRTEREGMRQQVKAVVLRSCGVNCEVVLVAPRSLPFTSSGKLSRTQARVLYLAGEIGEIDKERRQGAMLKVAAAN